jgi:hypothetical protein
LGQPFDVDSDLVPGKFDGPGGSPPTQRSLGRRVLPFAGHPKPLCDVDTRCTEPDLAIAAAAAVKDVEERSELAVELHLH